MKDLTPQFARSAEHRAAVKVAQENREDCTVCGGDGERVAYMSPNIPIITRHPCKQCGGTGQDPEAIIGGPMPCSLCGTLGPEGQPCTCGIGFHRMHTQPQIRIVSGREAAQ